MYKNSINVRQCSFLHRCQISLLRKELLRPMQRVSSIFHPPLANIWPTSSTYTHFPYEVQCTTGICMDVWPGESIVWKRAWKGMGSPNENYSICRNCGAKKIQLLRVFIYIKSPPALWRHRGILAGGERQIIEVCLSNQRLCTDIHELVPRDELRPSPWQAKLGQKTVVQQENKLYHGNMLRSLCD